MKKNLATIEERIRSIKTIYQRIDDLCANLPEGLNNKYVGIIKEAVLENKELDELVKSLDEYRPPRVLLIGRTGFGKSSIINAMFGEYVAEVNDAESCTRGTTRYTCSFSGGAQIDIMDTRGLDESLSLDNEKSAEEQLLQDIEIFDPDVALFVLSCASRDGIDDDIDFVKDVRKACYKKNAVELPVVVAINKADSVQPTREQQPFSEEKNKTINKIKSVIEGLLEQKGLKTSAVIAVSSCIDWMDEGGKELKSAEQINALTKKQRENLGIAFDGRYHIEELKEALEESVVSAEANMGIKMAFHLNEILSEIAEKFINIFCAIALAVVGASLPGVDYYILVALEVTLVALIMALSGRNVDMESAKEFIVSVSGTGAVGLALRQVARAAIKMVPGGGNIISGAVAMWGVKMIGQAAVEYFINDVDINEVKKEMQSKVRLEKAKVAGKKIISATPIRKILKGKK